MQELLHYLRMLQRSWWIVAITVLAALNIALAASYLDTPLYRTSAQFIVSPGPSLLAGEDKEVVNSIEALDKRSVVVTYSEVLNSNRIYRETAAALQIEPEMLNDYHISAVVLPDASILELSIEGPDPEMTALLANSLAQRAIDYIESLYLVYNIDLLDPATIPTKPFNLKPGRNASLAVILGVVLGSALAILREELRFPLNTLQKHFAIDNASSAYTHRYFQRRLNEEITQSQAGDLILGMIWLEGLRDLRETLPRPAFQRLLRRVTNILRSELRGKDVIGRWDDTSFAVLLPATSDLSAADSLDRIQRILSEPLPINQNGQAVRLKPCVGLSPRQGDESATVLIEQAKFALRQARQNGVKTVISSPRTSLNSTRPSLFPDQVHSVASAD